MEGSRHVGHLSIQISGQNMKVVRPDGQIIQGPQLIQGPLDHCKWAPNFALRRDHISLDTLKRSGIEAERRGFCTQTTPTAVVPSVYRGFDEMCG